MKCKHNIKTAITAYSAIRAGNTNCVLSLVAPNAIFNYNGGNAKIPGTDTPVIPFAGPLSPQQFFEKLNTFTITNVYSDVQDVSVNCDCSQVILTVNITSQIRCSATSQPSPPHSEVFLLRFSFNQCGQITRLDIFTDNSLATLFYALGCGVLAQ